MDAEDYVTSDAQYAERMDSASGVRGTEPNMPPYPLYGIPGSLGQATPETGETPLWKKPWFAYSAGAAGGFGLAYAFFTWFKPKYLKKNKKNPKRRARTAKAVE